MPENIPFIVDAHLDLAMNAMEWNRDLRWSIGDIRNAEIGLMDKPDRTHGTVNFQELRKGNVGLVVGTQIARFAKTNPLFPGASWNSQEQAWAQTQGQRIWYELMEQQGHIVQIKTSAELKDHLNNWNDDSNATPIGLIRSLEGADSIVSFKHLEIAYESGLRLIGPAHYGPGVYAQGTDATGGLGEKGRGLLDEMSSLNMVLDASHLCDDSFWEALDYFDGPILASHNNCRTLVPHNRQFSDDQIKVLIERDAVIGGVMDAWMLTPEWVHGKSNPKDVGVSLEMLVDHMDHICQIAGNANHVAIGSDLDGAFGREQCPVEINTIADLQLLIPALRKRGYSEANILAICSGNWINFFLKNLN